MFQKLSCLPYVFDSVLACAKPAHARVSEALLPALRTLSLSYLTNSSSDSKAFQHFIAFSGSPTAVHHAFLFFNVKAWPQPQTVLFTCTTSTTLWAYLSKSLVKDKFNRKTTILHASSYLITRRGIQKHCKWRKWLTYHSRCKFITLLTFELSSFRANGFFFLLHFLRYSHWYWYLSLDA